MTSAAYVPATGITAKTNLITCELKGNAKITGAKINMARDADGKWSCEIDKVTGWKEAYTPAGCTAS